MSKKQINFVDDNDFLGRMTLLTGDKLFNDLRKASDNYDADFTDALSWGQLKSKRWLVNELQNTGKELRTVFVLGGWYGTLSAMLFNSNMVIHYIRSFDIDEKCQPIADAVNNTYVQNDWQFKAITEDMFNINYDAHTWSCWSVKNNRNSFPITDRPDTIINTSCEHIKDFTKWYDMIPKGKLICLQSNNYVAIDDHVNCATSLKEFEQQAPMSNVLYEGELDLGKYTRYMRIGIK